jgi:hypothetical protein
MNREDKTITTPVNTCDRLSPARHLVAILAASVVFSK